MRTDAVLDRIRNELFYGSRDYTKNQPDLFVAKHFSLLAPSEAGGFFETLLDALPEPDLLLYVHLPFCFSECLFCNSFPQKSDPLIQGDYISRLREQVRLYARLGLFQGRRVKCICLGGGTPTSFSNEELRRLLETIRSCAELTDDCTIASEAHPATLERPERVQELAAMGIDRISIGCQTFDRDILARCNRRNTPDQVRRIVELVQGSGMMINIDMMTGLPGQTLESVAADLRFLELIRPDAVEYIRHEIVNPLVVDLYTRDPQLIVPDDDLFRMVYLTQKWMESQGYEQNGRFSSDRQWPYRYYWLREMPIISFGARTRSYSSTICCDSHEELPIYSRMIQKGAPPIARYIALSPRERMYRTLILSLQLKEGLDITRFHARFGLSPHEAFAPLISRLVDLGCLHQQEESLRLTRYGACFVEDVCDCIIDSAFREDGRRGLVRAPHSGGSTPLAVPPSP